MCARELQRRDFVDESEITVKSTGRTCVFFVYWRLCRLSIGGIERSLAPFRAPLGQAFAVYLLNIQLKLKNRHFEDKA
jgi:hypothetical protein